jgi:hypothetical protein
MQLYFALASTMSSLFLTALLGSSLPGVQAVTLPNSGSTASSKTNGTVSGDMASCLVAHNRFRSMGGAPLLVWDAGLAGKAASALAARGLSLRHSSNGNGENIFVGFGGRFSCESAVKAWYQEKAIHDRRGMSSYSNRYTQLMWKSTKKLGCATARGSGGQVVYVCQYFPAATLPKDTNAPVKPAKPQPPPQIRNFLESDLQPSDVVERTNIKDTSELTSADPGF